MRRVVLLVLFGLLLGVLLTAAAGALPGSQDLNALSWLTSVSTVAALVVAVGIFRVQQSQSDSAHQELLDALKAQDEILQDLADPTPAAPSPAPAAEDDTLSPAQRQAVEARYGDGSIVEVRNPRAERGSQPRLVRLDDGSLVTVFGGERGGQVRMRRVKPRGDEARRARDRRSRGPESR